MEHYYHIFANGDDAQNFITSEEDFRAAFNRFSLCASRLRHFKVLAFSIEESHPHCLAYGSFEDCVEFKRTYEVQTFSYIAAARGNRDGVNFELEISEIKDEDYLLNAAAYVLVQPTKDGKQIMPYDYYWGTASMYFRPEGLPPIWCYDGNWQLVQSVEYGSLSYRSKRALTHSTIELPPDWLICNGIVLPSNYIAVDMFESIFKSFNRFRVFMSAGRKQLQIVSDGMAITRGINLQDIEARQLARSVSDRMFKKKDARWLTIPQRLHLAKELRFNHHLSIRQTATLTRLPEIEIRKYFL